MFKRTAQSKDDNEVKESLLKRKEELGHDIEMLHGLEHDFNELGNNLQKLLNHHRGKHLNKNKDGSYKGRIRPYELSPHSFTEVLADIKEETRSVVDVYRRLNLIEEHEKHYEKVWIKYKNQHVRKEIDKVLGSLTFLEKKEEKFISQLEKDIKVLVRGIEFVIARHGYDSFEESALLNPINAKRDLIENTKGENLIRLLVSVMQKAKWHNHELIVELEQERSMIM
jgi:hypothetical protein